MAVEETPQERRAVYETSSQFHHWRFSEAQLEQSRSSLNKAAVAAIKVAFEAESARLGFTILSICLLRRGDGLTSLVPPLMYHF